MNFLNATRTNAPRRRAAWLLVWCAFASLFAVPRPLPALAAGHDTAQSRPHCRMAFAAHQNKPCCCGSKTLVTKASAHAENRAASPQPCRCDVKPAPLLPDDLTPVVAGSTPDFSALAPPTTALAAPPLPLRRFVPVRHAARTTASLRAPPRRLDAGRAPPPFLV